MPLPAGFPRGRRGTRTEAKVGPGRRATMPPTSQGRSMWPSPWTNADPTGIRLAMALRARATLVMCAPVASWTPGLDVNPSVPEQLACGNNGSRQARDTRVVQPEPFQKDRGRVTDRLVGPGIETFSGSQPCEWARASALGTWWLAVA